MDKSHVKPLGIGSIDREPRETEKVDMAQKADTSAILLLQTRINLLSHNKSLNNHITTLQHSTRFRT